MNVPRKYGKPYKNVSHLPISPPYQPYQPYQPLLALPPLPTPDSLGALSVGELNSPRVAPLPTP
ncbi:hypothetical protein BJP36_38175 [Moorena producens JHB]|uniref:Uncharacterized protein n=1 Tax=Moorena producens (strain JHB) TaxID=1454205 RepID=A0A9Q9UWI1_MOOP1|nr:hypothetical protein [Moorena producens]WAN69921.1 hypothetical protein BJP36_38175 [Moorena producens JHB]